MFDILSIEIQEKQENFSGFEEAAVMPCGTSKICPVCFAEKAEILVREMGDRRRTAMQGKVEICGVNTSQLTVLSAEEMDRLLHRSTK